ncbi:MAG: translation elongation factor Ts [bacterium]
MAELTTAMITDLRARTNAGMMDCKKALQETSGDMDAAIKLLRERGQAIQVKRAAKEANQGIVSAATSTDGQTMALAEVNCETDFVAKTEGFKKFVVAVADKVLAGDENVAETMKDELVGIVAATGENVKIRRVARYGVAGTGRLESYIHMGGKVGVLVELSCGRMETVTNPAFAELIHDLALQVAAAAPRWLDGAAVPADVIASEKDIYRTQVVGKPANIIEKILDGKIKKFFGEVCLVDQVFVKDEAKKLTISQLVADTAKKLGDTVVVRRFVRYQLGAA